jgi:glyoxylase I family protein
MFTFHHTAISVSDLEKSMVFYRKLAFTDAFRWDATDGTLSIAHMKMGTTLLELFAYTNAADDPNLQIRVGGNLDEIGVKHIALSVPSLEAAYADLDAAGVPIATEMQDGRTGIRFFFVRDPDGLWVEIVEDNRT